MTRRVLEREGGFQYAASRVVDLRDWVQGAEQDNGADNHEDDEDHEAEANDNFLPFFDSGT